MDVNTFTYDAMERLLNISLSHDGADAVTLSSNTYDAVGRLASCAVNDGGSNTSYAYNVRGWMQSVTNNHFHTKGTVLLVCLRCVDIHWSCVETCRRHIPTLRCDLCPRLL